MTLNFYFLICDLIAVATPANLRLNGIQFICVNDSIDSFRYRFKGTGLSTCNVIFRQYLVHIEE